MKELDFKPAKSKEDFRKNYKLHDLAETTGKNLLTQWGFDFVQFGEDRRFEKLWEGGKDKPDVVIKFKGKLCLLDWKGKHKSGWIVNTRAVNSYLMWNQKLNLPVVIVFFVFNEDNTLKDRRFAFLPVHKYVESEKKQWDKNSTVIFRDDLSEFTKDNLVKYLFQ